MLSGRLNNIDSLRGIAALLVVWLHSAELFIGLPGVADQGSLLASFAGAVDTGRVGVVCFFLISGFVIPFSFSGTDGAIKNFALSRFFRLYPVYWVSILLAMVTAWALSDTVFVQDQVLANITMLQVFFGQPHILGLYWTLQAEVIFYLLCVGLYAAGLLHNHYQQLVACLLALAVFFVLAMLNKTVILFQDIEKELLYLPYVVSIMFCGTVLRALLFEQVSGRPRQWLLLAPLAVFGLPLGVFALSVVDIRVVDSPSRFLLGHILGLMIFLAGYYGLRRAHRSFLWLGTISYSIYLFHPIVMQLLHWLVQQSWASVLTGLHLSVYLLMAFVITVGMASVTWLWIEQPSIKLGRRLKRKESSNYTAAG